MKNLSALLVCLCLLLAPSAEAQRNVARIPVESGLFANSGYLLLRWNNPPSFTSDISAQRGQSLPPRLDITFAQPATFDFEQAQQRLSEFVQTIAVSDARRVSITLQPKVRVETRRDAQGITFYFHRTTTPEITLTQRAQARRVESFAPSPTPSGQATPFEVIVSAQRGQGYNRLSFEWQSDVDYRAQLLPRQQQGQQSAARELIITFNKPAVFNNLQGTLRRLSSVVGSEKIERNGTQLRIEVRAPMRLRDFAYGNRVVIDLLPEDDSGLAAPRAPPSPTLPTVSVRAGQLEGYTRFLFDYKQPTQYLVRRRGARLDVEFNRANPLSFRELGLPRGSPFTPPRAQRFADSVRFSIPVPRENTFRHFVSGTRIVLDVNHRVEVSSPRLSSLAGRSPSGDLPEIFLPEPRRFGLAQDEASNPSPSEIAASRPLPIYQLRVPLSETAAVAFFKRGSHLWFVTDRAFDINASPDARAAEQALGKIGQISAQNFTVLRFSPGRELYPAVRREGLSWWLEFHESPVPPYLSVDTIITQETQGRTQFTFLLPRYGNALRLEDPDVGDEIYVVLAPIPSLGIARAHRYPEFQVLASGQGVAFVPLASDLQVSEEGSRVILSRHDGLRLSTLDVDRAVFESAADALIQLPVLNFSNWAHPGESFEETRYQFNKLLLQGADEEARKSALDLAGYYLSQGLGQETIGLLDLYARDFPASGLRYRLMRAIALLLSFRSDEALGVLRAPIFDRVQEAYIWRAVAAAQERRWPLAERYFQQSGNFSQLYPPPIVALISRARIETALQQDNSSAAAQWINRTKNLSGIRRSNADAVLYFEGALEALRGKPQQARALWQSLQGGSSYNYWQVRAQLESLVLARDNNLESLPDLLAQFERLYFAWRGDLLAFRILEELGKSYGLASMYYQELQLYREAITRYSFLPESAALSEKMVSLFQEWFLTTEQALVPWHGYLIYADFKELIPPGATRTPLIEAAADLISSGGFYEIAAEILEQDLLSNTALENQEYFVVKTGLLFLLAHLPQRALALLGNHVLAESSPYNSDARLLRARALLPLKESRQAEVLLAGDISEEADLLRFLIHRNNQNWTDAAEALQRLVGPPPQREGVRLSEQQALRLLYLVSALYLAQENQALDSIVRDYAESLSETPLKALFDFLTSSAEESPPIAALLERLDESVAHENSFLALYKRRFLR